MARDQGAMSRRSDSFTEVNMKVKLFVMTLCVALPGFAQAQDNQGNSQNNQGGSSYPFRIQLSSTTFPNNDPQLPLIMIYTSNANGPGTNVCTSNGEAGGNQSPELQWTAAPRGTLSFVVIMYDVTASFTHWGMYNIAPYRTMLPLNAGVANSAFGDQIANDYGVGDQSYDGPCPPSASVSPPSHDYVFTIYALDIRLPILPTFDDASSSEALYHALIDAGRGGHILASASTQGFYSALIPPGL
jgi:Raf kinase inhibitor-like YbhB/YbcL family protein